MPSDFKVISCTQSQYNAQLSGETLVAGALYFTSDTLRIYKATSTSAAIPYSQPFVADSSFPESGQRQGTVYYNTSTKEARIWNGSGWTTVAYPVTTSISGSSTDSEIPTAKAVYDAIPQTGTTSGKVPVLDSNGKLANSVIPNLALSQYINTVSAKSSLTSLSTAQIGDYAIVSGDSTEANNGTYILNGEYGTLSNWIQISTPGSAAVTVDSSITENGANPVTGGAIYTALNGKSDTGHKHSASDITSGLAAVAISGSYSDLTTKLQWTEL